ncbi:MAG: hypothetical protein AAFR96_01910 [Planctomycetota bacterium]
MLVISVDISTQAGSKSREGRLRCRAFSRPAQNYRRLYEFTCWLGVPASEMSNVFPNIVPFLDPLNPAIHLGLFT